MRIFLAGAAGALGHRLVPMLIDAGHEVVGTTRSSNKEQFLRELGAQPVVLDALDRVAVAEAVAKARPEVVVHELTAIGGKPDFANLDRYFVATNELRTKGLDYLLEAARSAGARRFVAQSFTGWPNERSGSWVKTEDDPPAARAAGKSSQTLAAIKYVERRMVDATDMEGVALRYGAFYGPGNALGRGGEMESMLKARKLPIVGGGAGVWSFVHIDDAAKATHLAIEGTATGLFNIVDDEPAPVKVWLPYLAQVIGAKPPLRVPSWLVRPFIGDYVVALMTQNRGSSNAKAKRVFGWQLRYPSWRQGFHALG
jgi:nucleoside-diphosphate-sugar epimerase